MNRSILFWLVSVSFAIAGNPVCENTEESQIYNTGCYSFGDEFVFVSDAWPTFGNGDKMPEDGYACFNKSRIPEDLREKYCCKLRVFRTEDDSPLDFSRYGNFGVFYSECEYRGVDEEDTLSREVDEMDAPAVAENPVCENTEESQIYNTGCYSFGGEFVFVSNAWPSYDNGDKKPEGGSTCFDKFRISKNAKGKKIVRKGFVYGEFPLEQYCCNHWVFRTDSASYGNEYIDFSYYGNFGAYYWNCEYHGVDKVRTLFWETEWQKPMDEVDFLNLTTNAENIFGSQENAMMKMATLAAIAKNDVIPFKIYRKNKTVKYIGSPNLGFCMSKNGKRALDFAKGPEACK